MKQKPRNPKENLFDKSLIQELFISATAISILVFIVWYFLLNNIGMEVTHARGYIMALMVFVQNFHVLNCRNETKSIFKTNFFSNPFILVGIIGSVGLQIIIMEVDFLSNLLSTSKVPYEGLFVLLILSTSILIIMEIYKAIRRNKSTKIN